MFVLCTVLPYDCGRVRVRAVTLRLRPCAGRDCRTADGYGRAHISAYGRLRAKASAKHRPAAASGAVFISDVMHCYLVLLVPGRSTGNSIINRILVLYFVTSTGSDTNNVIENYYYCNCNSRHDLCLHAVYYVVVGSAGKLSAALLETDVFTILTRLTSFRSHWWTIRLEGLCASEHACPAMLGAALALRAISLIGNAILRHAFAVKDK